MNPIAFAVQQIENTMQNLCPDEAERLRPFWPSLLAAQQAGHSFIFVSDEEAAVLRSAVQSVGDGRTATPLVLHGRRLFTGRVFGWEQALAQQLWRLASGGTVRPPEDDNDALRQENADALARAGAKSLAQAVQGDLFGGDGRPPEAEETAGHQVANGLLSAAQNGVVAVMSGDGRGGIRPPEAVGDAVPAVEAADWPPSAGESVSHDFRLPEDAGGFLSQTADGVWPNVLNGDNTDTDGWSAHDRPPEAADDALWQTAGGAGQFAADAHGQHDDAWLRQRLQAWFPDAVSQGQQAACALAVLQRLTFITGGPGTGKTTTVAKLLALLCGDGGILPRIALAAPTGKAAAHMSRSLQRALQHLPDTGETALAEPVRRHLAALEGQTLHRLLRLNADGVANQARDWGSSGFLPYDVIVVDEASMLDWPLLLQLLAAVAPNARCVLLGDEAQLPPVGLGGILPLLPRETRLTPAQAQTLAAWLPTPLPFQVAEQPEPLASHIARLHHSHRFDASGGVGVLARAVAAGETDAACAAFVELADDLSVWAQSLSHLAERLYGLQVAYWQAVDAGDVAACFVAYQQVAVLAAQRAQAEAFNRAYVAQLRQQRPAIGDGPYFAGQALMMTENDYSVRVFNGDIGIVLPHEGALMAFFPDGAGFRPVALGRLPACDTAFAMTVHKSQGSEFGEVWLLPPDERSEHGLFDRSLLYTAITRARQRFAYCGDLADLPPAIERTHKRRTALRQQLARVWRA